MNYTVMHPATLKLQVFTAEDIGASQNEFGSTASVPPCAKLWAVVSNGGAGTAVCTLQFQMPDGLWVNVVRNPSTMASVTMPAMAGAGTTEAISLDYPPSGTYRLGVSETAGANPLVINAYIMAVY